MYDINYFLRKFSEIPENMFITYDFTNWNGGKCFAGHCMSDNAIRKLFRAGNDDRGVCKYNFKNEDLENGAFAEIYALCKLFDPISRKNGSDIIFKINNGNDPRYQQPIIKQRILAALYDIKKLQDAAANPPEPKAEPVKEKVRVNYVAVPETIKESLPTIVYS